MILRDASSTGSAAPQDERKPLYTTAILRLAASLPDPVPLDAADGEAEERSPTCGSSVRTQIRLDSKGRVEAISQQVQACAFGQASASLAAGHAAGRGRDEVAEALTGLSGWLTGERGDPGDWPGLEALAPARSRTGRHGAILLPFRALLSAIEAARR